MLSTKTNAHFLLQGQRPDEPAANFYYWLLNSQHGLHWTLPQLRRTIANAEDSEKPFDWTKLLREVQSGPHKIVSFERLNRRQFGELVKILAEAFAKEETQELPKATAANVFPAEESVVREPSQPS